MSNILYVSLVLSKEDNIRLHKLVKEYVKVGPEYIERKESHITLCYYSDFDNAEEFNVFTEQYLHLLNKQCNIQIDKIAMDDKCIALCVVPSDYIPYYPKEKNLHITMLLTKGTKPVYSNEMIRTTKTFIDVRTDVYGQIVYVKK